MTFPSVDEYWRIFRQMSLEPEWAAQIEWCKAVKFPETPEKMAWELIYVICNSGMKHSVAAQIFERVRSAITQGRPVTDGLKHPGKAKAIDWIWNRRVMLRKQARYLKDEDLVEWCGKLPWIGGITGFHAAKNLGANVAKPDRWLVRMGLLGGETTDEICQRISKATGHRVALVDLVLWWGAAYSFIRWPK